jgi:hypothetical protein
MVQGNGGFPDTKGAANPQQARVQPEWRRHAISGADFDAHPVYMGERAGMALIRLCRAVPLNRVSGGILPRCGPLRLAARGACETTSSQFSAGAAVAPGS